MIKNIIFDLDGTLANTSEDIIDSLNFALGRIGFSKKINLKIFKKIANKGSLHMIQMIVGKKNTNSNKVNNYFLEHYKKNICNKTSLKKNVTNFLRYCKNKNIKLFISTNKNQKNAVLILKRLKIYKFFNFIAGSDTFKYQKPNPLHLSSLKKKFSLKKIETIFIGDTEIDSNLANKFNIKFILVKNGYTNLKPHQIKSDFVITNYSNISRIIKIISSFSK